jgi:hypothetical protein
VGSVGRRGEILGEGGMDMMMVRLQGRGGKCSGGNSSC